MIYLDNAATSRMKPDCVIDAVADAMRNMGNAGRGTHEATLDASRGVYETRALLAEFFHAEDASRIAFTANSTEALNIAIRGLFEPKDHVISTVLEHNSVLRPLYLEEERGVEVTRLMADEVGNISYEELKAAIRPNTKAVMITHASNLTGNSVDIKQIRRILDEAVERHILLVVDASQTAGVLPIDVEEMGIDILCFTGHKGLLGPQGTGGIYVRTGIEIRPLKVGGSGIQTYNKKHPAEMPTALEAGTLNAHGLMGLKASVQWIRETGVDRIHEKEMRLLRRFYEGVKNLDGVKVYGDFSTENRVAICSINVRDYDSSEVSDVLATDYDIATRPGGHCAPLMHEALGTVKQGMVRFSFSYFNTEEEIDAAIEAVKEIANE